MDRREIRIDFCDAARGETLNFYIHGYSAVNNEQEENELKSKIPLRDNNTTNVFIFWPAGDIRSFDYKKLFNYAFLNVAGIIGATADITYGFINNYLAIERAIPDLAYQLIFKINAFIKNENIKYKQINFIGHSLGARMIIESILKLPNEFNALNINNIVFMGGARSLNKKECQDILNVISGSIFNIYSNGDRVLQFIKPDLEKCIGRYAIDAPDDAIHRVKNNAFHWLGHLDYWDNLPGIMNYIDLEGVSTKHLIPLGSQDGVVKNSFAVQDVGLYLPLYHATEQEKKLLARILCGRSSTSIQPDETNPLVLTHELQLMGGDSIANKLRGHGVCYREILDDVAEKLEISQRKDLGFISLEATVYSKIVSLILDELKNSSEETKVDYLNMLEKIAANPRAIDKKNNPFFERLLKQVSSLASNTISLSGPAFSVTIPAVMLIHHIRKRVSQDLGEFFLFADQSIR